MTCPVCGTVTVPGARFCHNCGAALPAAATLPAAERRVVTVLFGDLSDFTAWAEGVDPERVGAVTDRVLAALAGAVKTFGGHVDKLTGDGIMAVFGAPVAHEDDPERAVRAALAMQRAVRRVLDDERGGGAPSGLRIGRQHRRRGRRRAGRAGVHGHRRHREHRGPAGRRGRRRRGLRRRRDRAPRPGTWPPGGGCCRCGSRASATPVEAYELLGLLDAPGTRSGLGDEGPFVGRETELALVASRLAEVVDRGEPRVLVFTAEAGLGKTRLAAEVARFAAGYDARPDAGGGARVLSVRCAAYGERWRLGPLADLVRAAVGLPDQTSVAVTRAVAEERLRRVAQIVGAAHRRRAAAADRAAAGPARLRRPAAGPRHGGRAAPAGRGRRAPTPRRRRRAVAELLSALAARGAAGGDRRRPARRQPADRRRARRHAQPAGRPGAGGAAGPAGAGALGRRADPPRRRRGASAAAAARRRGGPAAHRLPRRRAAARRRTPTGCSPPPRATRSTWPSWSRC